MRQSQCRELRVWQSELHMEVPVQKGHEDLCKKKQAGVHPAVV